MVWWLGCRPMSQKFVFYFWTCQKAFSIIITIYICHFPTLFCHIFGNSQERQEIILEGGCHHPFWFAKLPQYSQILKYSVFILFIHLCPHRITMSVNRYPMLWLEIQYLWRHLAKIHKIPIFFSCKTSTSSPVWTK